MERYPEPDEVIEALGDKVVAALTAAILGARADLAEYRRAMPHFVADHSSRGLANWIHDRIWARIVTELDDVDGVSFVDSGPLRELYVNADFRLRFKRHSPTGAIRSYPTVGALDFITQEPDLLTLIGIRTLNLTAGYEWDDLARVMGDPVLSLRDGSFDEVIWMSTLPVAGGAAGGTISPIKPTTDGPTPPVIEAPRYDSEEHEGTDDA